MNEYYGKLAGEQDALSSFGLAHGTPRPPPTWAQGWLDTTRKNGTKNLTIPSMREKRAFDPLTLGALGMGAKAMLPWLGKAALGGAASHVGGNIIQKGLRKMMPQLAQRQMASGITHGLENKTMHPVMQRLLSRGLGPEYLAPYQTGQAISKQVAGMPAAKREAYLRQASGVIGESKHMSKAPIAGAIPGAVETAGKKPSGFWHRLIPTAAAGTKFEDLPRWQRAIPTAVGLPLTIAEPGLAGHVAINKIREHIGHSDTGRSFMANELAQGARGKELPGWKKNLMEFGLSPATTDPRNIGLAANKEYGDWHGRVNQWAAEHGHGPVPLPGAGQVADFAEGIHNRLKAKQPPPANSPSPEAPAPSHGVLGKALLAGGGMYALNKAIQPDEEVRR
jgi:hypothetical protein